MKNTIKKQWRAFFSINLVWTFTFVVCGISAPEERNSQRSKDAALSLLGIEMEKQTVPFGDKTHLRVTLQNNATSAITFPNGALMISCKEWSRGGASGTLSGDLFPLRENESLQTLTVIEPGKPVVLLGEDEEAASVRLGQFQVTYSLSTQDAALKKLLPKPAEQTLAIEVTPSELVTSVWAANTEEARKRLLPQIRALLKLEAFAKEDDGWSKFRLSMNYMGDSLFSLLEMAFNDKDPLLRKQVLETFSQEVWAIYSFNSFLEENKQLDWASNLKKSDAEFASGIGHKVAALGLNDKDAGVRSAAIEWFTQMRNEAVFEKIKQLAADKEASVREVAQKYLTLFAGKTGATDVLFASLSDADAKVRQQALAALEQAEKPPPLDALNQAYKASRDGEALRLLDLLFEQENAAMPAILLENFKKRSPQERLRIMTMIAGHADAAAMQLITLGLQDISTDVQRAALLRLAAIPSAKSLPLIQAYAAKVSAGLRPLAQSVHKEIVKRQQFPFASESSSEWLSARETVFPSHSGSVPMVSPDGQWVAYVETGWGRPGGTGGTGRSNLLSITHVVKNDGKDDRIVSDMFLVQWMPDSKTVASARDGHMGITDLDGNTLTEFGQPLSEDELKYQREKGDWREGYLRGQLGGRMPHKKRIPISFESMRQADSIRDWGENAAFSPDGKWFGPLLEKKKIVFFDENWQRLEIKLSKEYYEPQWQCTWSPDGKYVLMIPYGGNDDIYQPFLIDFQARTMLALAYVGSIPKLGDWEYRKCRWNPWSKDGSRMTFVREGQIWLADADGSNPKQITFDSAQKLFPVFSRDGKRLAYLTWQPDNRRHFERLGPTDIWVVDIETTLAARVTAPSQVRINCLEWLDHNTLIFDRVEGAYQREASLRVLSLLSK